MNASDDDDDRGTLYAREVMSLQALPEIAEQLRIANLIRLGAIELDDYHQIPAVVPGRDYPLGGSQPFPLDIEGINRHLGLR